MRRGAAVRVQQKIGTHTRGSFQFRRRRSFAPKARSGTTSNQRKRSKAGPCMSASLFFIFCFLSFPFLSVRFDRSIQQCDYNATDRLIDFLVSAYRQVHVSYPARSSLALCLFPFCISEVRTRPSASFFAPYDLKCAGCCSFWVWACYISLRVHDCQLTRVWQLDRLCSFLFFLLSPPDWSLGFLSMPRSPSKTLIDACCWCSLLRLLFVGARFVDSFSLSTSEMHQHALLSLQI